MVRRHASTGDFGQSLGTLTSLSEISALYRSIDAANVSAAIDGPADGEIPETASERRQRWSSLLLGYVLIFLTSVEGNMIFTAMWPFLKQVDPSAREDFLGYVVMTECFGTAAAAAILGWLADRFHNTKWPIIASLLISAFGNTLFAFTESFSANRKWIVFASRFICGLGRGSLGPLYAYIVMASKESERTRAISVRAALYSIGDIAGPGIQAVFVPIGYPGFESGELRLNMYTTPAIVTVVVSLMLIPVLLCLFKEYWFSVADEASGSRNFSEQRILHYDKCAVITCITLTFTTNLCMSDDDVVQAPYSMIMFGWSASQTILYNGLLTTGLAVLGTAGYLLVGSHILNHVSERVVILFGLVAFMGAYFVIISWPGLPPLNPGYKAVYNASNTAPTIGSGRNSSCDHTWCSYTTQATLAQYITAHIISVVAAVMIVAPIGTLFSKAIGPRKQGTLQGMFTASQELPYCVGPIVWANLFHFMGPNAVWVVCIAIIAASITLTGLTFNRLLPWSARVEEAEAKPLLELTTSQ